MFSYINSDESFLTWIPDWLHLDVVSVAEQKQSVPMLTKSFHCYKKKTLCLQWCRLHFLWDVHLSKTFISHFCVQPSNFCCSLSFFNVFKHRVYLWTLINIFINIKYHNQVIQYLDYNLFNHFIIFFWKTFCRLLCYQSFHSRRSHSFTVFCMTYMSTH